MTIARQIIRSLNKRWLGRARIAASKLGGRRCCNICRNTFGHFTKYKGGTKNIPEFRKKLVMVGSDVDNFGCPYCGANDRERHLFLFFEEIGLWDKIPALHILHFAPEKHVAEKITSLHPPRYIQADLSPKLSDVVKMSATNIPHESDSFDLILCNHVLEHIPNYKDAVSEILRVLKHGGTAIFQTPFSKVLSSHFEEENIMTDNQRAFFTERRTI